MPEESKSSKTESLWWHIQRVCAEVEASWPPEKLASANAAIEIRLRRDLERHPSKRP